MKTEQILQLDCREEKNKEIIQSVLRKIKPLSKCKEGNDVPIELIERVIKILCSKYGYHIRQLYPDYESSDKYIIWRSEIYIRSTLQDVGVIYGCSIYECLSKTVIALYALSRERNKGGK